MPVLLARVGKDRLMSEAVESHIGGWFWNAASGERIRPVTQPEYGYELPSSSDEPFAFTAEVGVQPKPEPADWTTLEVPAAEPDVPDELVEHELEALRSSVAELVPVEGRARAEGDALVIDVGGSDAEAQRDLVVSSAPAASCRTRGGLAGMRAGESKQVEYALPDDERRTVEVTVKEVKEPVLPPLDDELARAASEFETLEELRGDIEGRLREQIEEELEDEFRGAAVDALVEASAVEVSESLVEARAADLLRAFVRGSRSAASPSRPTSRSAARAPRRSRHECARRRGGRWAASSSSRQWPSSWESRFPTRSCARSSASRQSSPGRTIPRPSSNRSGTADGTRRSGPTCASGQHSIAWPRRSTAFPSSSRRRARSSGRPGRRSPKALRNCGPPVRRSLHDTAV